VTITTRTATTVPADSRTRTRTRTRTERPPRVGDRPSLARRLLSSAWLWSPLICALQVALALRHGLSTNAFEDEGLYVYTGHSMIQHFVHGTFLPMYPGAFFSGAPGLYPVLAAMADAVGGLAGARGVSLLFAVVATVATYGIGNRLFGKVAGLIGALSMALCGSVIYISHLATYDSMTMAFVALAAWVAVFSAQRNGFAWAPAVSLLLTIAFLTKYAGAVYVPIVVALAVVVGFPLYGWKVVRRGAFAIVGVLIMAFSALELWGRSMIPGVQSTTSSRVVLISAPPSALVKEIATWVGPWLVLALLGGLFRLRRQWALVAILLLGAVIGPADQVRIGEATSLAKHVAFGMVFAAPLIGDLFARVLRKMPVFAAIAIPAALGLLGLSGLQYSHQFLTGWVNDAPLRPVLAQAIAARPGQKILGDRSSPQRYEFREQTKPNQWYDTYYFSYGGQVGKPAYAKAIDQRYFGVIYLDHTTGFGSYIYDYLKQHPSDYQLSATVPRDLRGHLVGHWYVFTPTTTGR
jgi:4-amino-4-deoxy-L-arabinose transferase-like glycosyltransferase